MIQFAGKDTKNVVKSMWKTCFDDSDEYIDLIFSKKYKDENTLIYFEGATAVASLQMQPSIIRFYGKPLPFYYLAGLCTLPEYRNKGYMGKLIWHSFRVMQNRGISLSVLVPAEDRLFDYYRRFGYEQTFEEGTQTFNLRSAVKEYNHDPVNAYHLFDSMFQKRDFVVLKTEKDFDIIMEEYMQDGQPDKQNLAAGSCTLNAYSLLQLYADRNKEKSFKIKVTGQFDRPIQLFNVCKGDVYTLTDGECDLSVDIKLFTRLLFGYKLDESAPEYKQYFTEHNPVINLMLE